MSKADGKSTDRVLVAEGMNPFQTEQQAEGVLRYLNTPQEVIEFIQSGEIKEKLVLARGGTTTFLSPALTMGALGVLTMSGAPESHLGILSREFQIPCGMTIHLQDGDSRYVAGETDEPHFQEIVDRLAGRYVVIDASDPKVTRVYEPAGAASEAPEGVLSG